MRLVVLFATIYLLLHTVDCKVHNDLVNVSLVQTETEYRYRQVDSHGFPQNVYIREKVLGVAVDSTTVVGPAQFEIRGFLNDSQNQVSNVTVIRLYEMNLFNFFPETIRPERLTDVIKAAPQFNFTTFENNVAKIEFATAQFTTHRYQFPVINSGYRPRLGDKLIAVFTNQDWRGQTNEEIFHEEVRVLESWHCEGLFESYNRAILSPNEICITKVFKTRGNALPNALLFRVFGGKIYYVANVSINAKNVGVSLASLIGPHCDHLDQLGVNVCTYDTVTDRTPQDGERVLIIFGDISREL